MYVDHRTQEYTKKKTNHMYSFLFCFLLRKFLSSQHPLSSTTLCLLSIYDPLSEAALVQPLKKYCTFNTIIVDSFNAHSLNWSHSGSIRHRRLLEDFVHDAKSVKCFPYSTISIRLFIVRQCIGFWQTSNENFLHMLNISVIIDLF